MHDVTGRCSDECQLNDPQPEAQTGLAVDKNDMKVMEI